MVGPTEQNEFSGRRRSSRSSVRGYSPRLYVASIQFGQLIEPERQFSLTAEISF